jgi:hypothetical protein
VTRICIDLETINPLPSEEDVQIYEAEVRQELKQEKAILARLEKFRTSRTPDVAGATVICAAVHDVTTNETVSFASAEEWRLAQWLNTILSEYMHAAAKLVGFALNKFDLPLVSKLFSRYGHEQKFKFSLRNTLDLQTYPFGKVLGMKPMNYYLRMYGIPLKRGSGADVAEQWAKDLTNGTNEVEVYCRGDVERTAELYRAMGKTYDI